MFPASMSLKSAESIFLEAQSNVHCQYGKTLPVTERSLYRKLSTQSTLCTNYLGTFENVRIIRVFLKILDFASFDPKIVILFLLSLSYSVKTSLMKQRKNVYESCNADFETR